jgi:hypothetical protein
MDSKKGVTPVPGFRRDRVTGVQEICNQLKTLDSGFRRNDGKRRSLPFSETIEDERL